jgi:hypothetical protein
MIVQFLDPSAVAEALLSGFWMRVWDWVMDKTFDNIWQVLLGSTVGLRVVWRAARRLADRFKRPEPPSVAVNSRTPRRKHDDHPKLPF